MCAVKVHDLKPEEMKNRSVVKVDIAMDQVPKKDYKTEEDPTLVHSEKANRGPLKEGWQVAPFSILATFFACLSVLMTGDRETHHVLLQAGTHRVQVVWAADPSRKLYR